MNLGTLRNAMPTLIIRSPFHRLMSRTFLLLEFRGRKSGRVYRTPLNYIQRGNDLWLTTDSAWWKNLRDGAPVRVYLQGRWVSGSARVVTDHTEATNVLRELVSAIPFYAGPAALTKVNGVVPDEEFARAMREERKAIIVSLA